ncbi:DUF3883 domain-containing protein [Methylocapsa palsarum]|uniref:Protein NO VEIN C-terminal domain-containing protein n=1 Tax=Methylocapsa palsarum TaxID=1612308 RepID=A0A1I3X390_9HYPH|nr:DUF3883 domain-containing protein [Methylocapsa palsarum]SFK13296.1 protein of unknown function [Methylocapsa palsarum]
MTDLSKVLWVKFGWSDWYRGGLVDGNFGWLNAQKGKKNEGRGHEAFNFAPDPDGRYHCYVPPQGRGYAPSNDDTEGWTVICLAKNPKHRGVHIVGWYENASLIGDRKSPNPSAGDGDGSYCITSKSAFFVPPEQRNDPFSDTSVGQSKYSFLAGPDVKASNNKLRVLSLLKRKLKALRGIVVHNPSVDSAPDPELDPVDPLKGFGTAEHRKKVEKAAEQAVIAHYDAKGFTSQRVTHIPCGYDFVFTKGKTVRHVEVKGTPSPNQQFFLTRNEYEIGLRSNPSWRLAMVISALSDADRRIVEYDAKALKQAFDLEPYVYLGKFVPEVEN